MSCIDYVITKKSLKNSIFHSNFKKSSQVLLTLDKCKEETKQIIRQGFERSSLQ